MSTTITNIVPATLRPAVSPARSTGSSAGGQGTPPLESAWNVGRALTTAKSAYTNDRFANVLEQLSDPRSSLVVALMRSEGGQTATTGFAQSAYADNS